MPYTECTLPKYPAEWDVWKRLKAETRPILIYGMGNGADKLIRKLDEYGIGFADIFASDGFVRGHSFHGIRVKSFSEVKEMYADFVIVLSFASNKPDVIEMLSEIDREYDMVLPDMPVAGEEEYFTAEFYNAHYDEIVRTYELLADPESRSIYASVINYKLTGKISYLLDNYSERGELYEIMPRDQIHVAVDGGAYNGDTAREMSEYLPYLSKIYALEPDRRSFKKLSAYAEISPVTVDPINAALWSEDRRGSFIDSGNRNSSVSSTPSYKHADTEIPLVSLDGLEISSVDHIKLDVEGAELEALIGAEKTIERDKPVLLVSIYHRSRDVFSIPLYLAEKYKFYDLYLRRLSSLPAWELDLILIRKEA